MYNSRSRQFFAQNLYNIKVAITLFTCFCVSCANPEVPQNKLFPDYKDLGINPDSSSIFNLNRDSSIYELNFANINLKGMFEVDNDKVFSINKIRNLNVRSLIFDFNAQLGDTIQRTNEIFTSIIVDNVTFKKLVGETEKIQNFRLSFKHLNPNFYPAPPRL